jgi:hypothetical protein
MPRAAVGQVEVSDVQRQQIERIFLETVKKANTLPDQLGLSAESSGVIHDITWGSNLGMQEGSVENPDASVSFSWPSLRVTAFHNLKNERLLRALMEERAAAEKQAKGKPKPRNSAFYAYSLNPDQAVARARKGLQALGFDIPANYELSAVDVGHDLDGVWSIRWSPVFEGIPFAGGQPSEVPGVAVEFSETLGMLRVRTSPILPEPKMREVRLSQQEAIQIAMKRWQEIEETPDYLRVHKPGYLFFSIEETALCVRAPNWYLDRERAAAVKGKPANETRICWRVHLLTRLGAEPEGEVPPRPPEHFIYLDAATGECIAADFK